MIMEKSWEWGESFWLCSQKVSLENHVRATLLSRQGLPSPDPADSRRLSPRKNPRCGGRDPGGDSREAVLLSNVLYALVKPRSESYDTLNNFLIYINFWKIFTYKAYIAMHCCYWAKHLHLSAGFSRNLWAFQQTICSYLFNLHIKKDKKKSWILTDGQARLRHGTLWRFLSHIHEKVH